MWCSLTLWNPTPANECFGTLSGLYVLIHPVVIPPGATDLSFHRAICYFRKKSFLVVGLRVLYPVREPAVQTRQLQVKESRCVQECRGALSCSGGVCGWEWMRSLRGWRKERVSTHGIQLSNLEEKGFQIEGIVLCGYSCLLCFCVPERARRA